MNRYPKHRIMRGSEVATATGSGGRHYVVSAKISTGMFRVHWHDVPIGNRAAVSCEAARQRRATAGSGGRHHVVSAKIGSGMFRAHLHDVSIGNMAAVSCETARQQRRATAGSGGQRRAAAGNGGQRRATAGSGGRHHVVSAKIGTGMFRVHWHDVPIGNRTAVSCETAKRRRLQAAAGNGGQRWSVGAMMRGLPKQDKHNDSLPSFILALTKPPASFTTCDIPNHLDSNFKGHAVFSNAGNETYWVLFLTGGQGMYSLKVPCMAVMGRRLTQDEAVRSFQPWDDVQEWWGRHCFYRHGQCAAHPDACAANGCYNTRPAPTHEEPMHHSIKRDRTVKWVVKTEPLTALKIEASRMMRRQWIEYRRGHRALILSVGMPAGKGSEAVAGSGSSVSHTPRSHTVSAHAGSSAGSMSMGSPLLDDPFYVTAEGTIHHSKVSALSGVGAGPVWVVMGWDAATAYAMEVAEESAGRSRKLRKGKGKGKTGEAMEVWPPNKRGLSQVKPYTPSWLPILPPDAIATERPASFAQQLGMWQDAERRLGEIREADKKYALDHEKCQKKKHLRCKKILAKLEDLHAQEDAGSVHYLDPTDSMRTTDDLLDEVELQATFGQDWRYFMGR
ncbi:hypothetical protein DFH09DRAFT_1088413 [Mycena vulgaris]|nr:hypothetical protein DFH09DRAFT_1088413 [Mycena vulgaris]